MGRELLPLDAEGINRYRLLATFNGCAVGNSRLMKLQHHRNEQHWNIIADAITALQEDGVLARGLDPKMEACGVIALVDGLADQVIMSPGVWSNEDLLALFDRHIESLLQASASMARRPPGQSAEKRRRSRAANAAN
jgi:hypothetical protein